MQEVLVNRLGSLSLPRKSVVRLTDRPDMTLDAYRGRKTTMQQQQHQQISKLNAHHILFSDLNIYSITCITNQILSDWSSALSLFYQ